MTAAPKPEILAAFEAAPRATEIFVTPFLPDAAEALIARGRLQEAERLIEALAENGRRLDRPWMLALGARCHAMLLAARRDVVAALDAASSAMVEHQRLPMPFERARTQLLLTAGLTAVIWIISKIALRNVPEVIDVEHVDEVA